MDSLLDWNRMHILIATTFVAINSLFFIPWRKSFKSMFIIGIISIVTLVGISTYVYFFTEYSLTLLLRLLDVAWVVLAFYLAKYRDARTLFVLMSVWMFCLAGSALALVCYYHIDQLWLRTVIIVVVHSIYPICILCIRKTYFTIMEFGKKGWLAACVIPVLPFFAIRVITLYPLPLSQNPVNIPAAALISITALCTYIILAKFANKIVVQKKHEQHISIMSIQSQSTSKYLEEAAKREKESAILRHDLRHFANVIASCIQNKSYDDALINLQRFMEHPAMRSSEVRYCKNPTINALLSSFAQRAEESGINFKSSIVLDENTFIDTLDLSILLSNSIENAINACQRQPEKADKGIRVKLTLTREQLFVSVANTCDVMVAIDSSTGLPKSTATKEGHGIGLHSIQQFTMQYNAQIANYKNGH